MKGLFYSGASGLVLPIPNKSFYPPEYQDKSRLCYYASLFNSIEINSSFYKIPMASTIQKWAADVPDDFRFTFKLWRDITHVKRLVFVPEDLHRFMKVIDNAGSKKGCLLVQFPASTTIESFESLKILLCELRKADPDKQWRIALEFRNQSWYQSRVYDLLNEYELALVLHDKSPSCMTMTYLDADFIYLRFHGPEGNYRGSYPDDFLFEYAGYIREWQDDGKAVYIYFNNTMGDAVKNLMSLNKYIKDG